MIFIERMWHPQPHQAKKNAIDDIIIQLEPTLKQRQEQAHEYYRQKCLALASFFLNHGVDINKTDDSEVK